MLIGEHGQGPHADFYSADDPSHYGRHTLEGPFVRLVRAFVAVVPDDGTVLEVGSGGGALDGIHPGYVASDFSLFALQRYSTGLRVQADARALPFAAECLDAVVTRATLEHVPEPERALAEIDRCLKPGGRALVFPAWFVRPWASRALHVRPHRELTPHERVVKLTIPVRDSRPYWFAKVLPARLRREAALMAGRRTLAFDYRRLRPNLEEFLASDSDAFSSMDPQAAASFFLSRGYTDLARPRWWQRVLYGYEPVMVQKAQVTEAPHGG